MIMLPDIRIQTSKEDRRLVEDFMDYPPYCLMTYLRFNQIMPIVEKIESTHDHHHGYFGVHISSNSCSIQGTNLHMAINDLSGYGYVYMSDPLAIFETKIESIWYNILEFIKWYNSYINKQNGTNNSI